jgi:YesN/AraC family two-component response regulator
VLQGYYSTTIHIKEGDCEKATERIRCIFDKFIFSTNTSKWSSDGLIHIILYNIMDLGISFSDDVAEKINKLNSISSIKDSVDLLCEIVSDICKENSDLDNKSNELYNTIKQYIDENYTQVGMNVFEVGEKYGMSSYYLSRMFKNHSGIKLGTYINNLRIERSKVLLKENPTMKIEDISLAVGFENRRTFLKNFKDIVGITPTQYRNK